MAQLKDKIENAVNETRILILGGQVLIGVSYRAFFEQQFQLLTPASQVLCATVRAEAAAAVLCCSFRRGSGCASMIHRNIASEATASPKAGTNP